MQKSRGKMGGHTRSMKKNHREKGIPPVSKFLQEFEVGSTVHIKIVSSEPKGMPDPRFNGGTGKIVGTQGKAYKVEVSDGDSKKVLLVNAVHLKEGKK